MRIILSRYVFVTALLFLIRGSAFSQEGSAEIFSPLKIDESKIVTDPELAKRSCLSFKTFQYVGCNSGELAIQYGARFGDNWDIFMVMAPQTSQTRGIDLGQWAWNETFLVPDIEPWPKLHPGETRSISINVSGEGGYGDKQVDKQVWSEVKSGDSKRRSNYSPFLQVNKEHIYAFRVVDEVNDFYLLIRIDDLIRGTKAIISYKKYEKKPIF